MGDCVFVIAPCSLQNIITLHYCNRQLFTHNKLKEKWEQKNWKKGEVSLKMQGYLFDEELKLDTE